MAANAAFSVNDLKQFKSSIKYDSQEGNGGDAETKTLEKETPTSHVEQTQDVEPLSQPPVSQPPIDPSPSNDKPISPPEIESSTLGVLSNNNDVQQEQPQLSRSSTAERSAISTTLIFGQEDEDDVVVSSIDQSDVEQLEKQEEQLPGLSGSYSVTTPTGQDREEALSAGQDGIRGEEGNDQPLSERIVSKNWKVRFCALEDLQQMFKTASGNDGIFNEFGDSLPRMLRDSNPSCIDAALEAATIYAERYSNAGSKAADIAKSVVSYGFSGRGSTASASEALLIKLMEVSTPEATVLVLLEGVNSKKPKIPPACISVIMNATNAFGATNLPLKAIKAILPTVLEHRLLPIRNGGMQLCKEIVRWIGTEPLQSIIDDLRPAVKSEFASIIKDVTPGSAVPSVYLRSQKPIDNGTNGKVGGGSVPSFNTDNLVDEVDLLSLLKSTEFDTKLAESIWSKKVEGMEIAISLIGPQPKLTTGDYGDLIKQIRTLVSHSHVQVCCTALKLIGVLARGMRRGFASHSRGVIRAAIGKLPDKKCHKAASDALHIIYDSACLTFDFVIDDVISGLDSKKVTAKWARLDIFQWASSCAMKSGNDPVAIGRFADAAMSSLEDGDSDIREAACAALAALSKSDGATSVIAPKLVTLKTSNSRMYKKVSGMTGETISGGSSNGVSCSNSPPCESSLPLKNKADGSPSASAKNSAPTKSSSSSSYKSAAPSTSSMGSKKNSRLKNATTSTSTMKSMPVAKNKEASSNINPHLPPFEDAIEEISGLGLPGWAGEEGIEQNLQSTKWQDRKAGMEMLGTEECIEILNGHLPALLSVLKQHTKSFKEVNFNVFKNLLNSLSKLLQIYSVPLSLDDKKSLAAMITVAAEKLSDRKLGESVSDMFTTAGEVAGPQFVIECSIQAAASGFKTPISRIELLNWMGKFIDSFGVRNIPVGCIVTFATTELENSTNVKLREASTKLLGMMYSRIGPPLRSMLPGGLNASVQSALDAGFNRIGFDQSAAAALKPAREVKTGVEAPNSSGGKGGGNTFDIPRKDIDSILQGGYLKTLGLTKGKDAWKGRKSAIEDVIAACKASGHHIEANRAAAGVIKGLKERLSDSQSNLKPLAAGAIAEVMVSLPTDASPKFCRLFHEALLGCISDNKKIMRETAISALDRILAAHGQHIMDQFVPPLTVALGSAVGRTELLGWLSKHLHLIQPVERAAALVKPLLKCLQDKSASVRQVSEDCLASIVAAGGASPSQIHVAARDYQPATLRAMKAGLQRICDAAPVTDSSVHGGGGGGRKCQESNEKICDPKEFLPRPSLKKKPLKRQLQSVGSATASETAGGAAAGDGGGGSPSDVEAVVALPCNMGKPRRMELERKQRWNEFAEDRREGAEEALKALWSPILPNRVATVLFPVNTGGFHNILEIYIEGISLLSKALAQDERSFIDHLDLVLRWITIRLHEKENVKVLQALLDLLVSILEMVKGHNGLTEHEVELILPTLLDKSGMSKDRFRALVRRCVDLASDGYPSNKNASMALAVAFATKSTRSRGYCIEEVERILESSGLTVLGKKGVKEVARFVDAREPEVRGPALDTLAVVYMRMDGDLHHLLKFVGDPSPVARGLIEERMRQADKRHGQDGAVKQQQLQLERGRGGAAAAGASVTTTASCSGTKAILKEHDIPHSSRTTNVVNPEEAASLEGLELNPDRSWHEPTTATVTCVGTEQFMDKLSKDQPDGPFQFCDEVVEVPLCSPKKTILRSDIVSNSNSNEEMIKKDVSPTRHTDNASDDLHPTIACILKSLSEFLRQPLPFSTKSEAYGAAKEQIKLMYYLAAESEGGVEHQEARRALCKCPGPVLNAMIECLHISCHSASVTSPRKSPANGSPLDTTRMESSISIDMPLLSSSLAALMAIVREMPEALSIEDTRHIVEVSCGCLMDPRLTHPDEPSAYKAAVTQVVRALNKLAIAAVESMPPTMAFAALLIQLTKMLIADSSLDDNSSSSSSTSGIFRMIVKLLGRAVKRDDSFKSVDLNSVIPRFCALYKLKPFDPMTPSSLLPPLESAATLLWSGLLSVHGAKAMHGALDKAVDISRDSPLYSIAPGVVNTGSGGGLEAAVPPSPNASRNATDRLAYLRQKLHRDSNDYMSYSIDSSTIPKVRALERDTIANKSVKPDPLATMKWALEAAKGKTCGPVCGATVNEMPNFTESRQHVTTDSIKERLAAIKKMQLQ